MPKKDKRRVFRSRLVLCDMRLRAGPTEQALAAQLGVTYHAIEAARTDAPGSSTASVAKGGGAGGADTPKFKSKFEQGEIAEDIAEKTGRVQPGQGALEETGIQPRQLARIYEHHHALVQQLRRWFKARGVNIDEFTIKLSGDEHRWIHNEYKWNALWKAFQRHNPLATPAQIRAQMDILLKEFGLEGLPIVPYPK